MKHQLRLCHRFLANSSILSEVQVGAGDIFDSKLHDVLDIELIESLKKMFPDLSCVFVPHWLDCKGSHFDSFSTVIVDINEEFGWSDVFG